MVIYFITHMSFHSFIIHQIIIIIINIFLSELRRPRRLNPFEMLKQLNTEMVQKGALQARENKLKFQDGHGDGEFQIPIG